MKITNREALITKYKMEINEIDAKLILLSAGVGNGQPFQHESIVETEKLEALKSAYVHFIDEIKII